MEALAEMPIHSPSGSRCRWTTRSVFMNIHLRGSSEAPTPLATSTMLIRYSTPSVSMPATMGLSVRTQWMRWCPSGSSGSGMFTMSMESM